MWYTIPAWRSVHLAIALTVVAAMSGGVVGAQTSTAALSGHVVDKSNGAVAGAKVTLVNELTNVRVETKVRQDGDFIFPDVQPGTFTVVIDAPGYKELRKVNLVLSASQNLCAGTMVLDVGQVSEQVTVSADVTPIQTTSAERSEVLDNKQMENLLAVGRDAMALTRTMPGVVVSGGSGGYGASSLGTEATPTVNGVSSEYNSATIDGVTGNTRGLSTLDTPLNLDAIQQITILTANYQAQYGKTAGSNINIVTKNGTSHFHGTAYEYFRNEDLNANSWFNNYTGAPRARYRYNTIGGTIGGPIFWPGKFDSQKNKLFFFVSLEYSPITTPDGLKYYRVPTQAEVNGDFSQTYNQGTATQTPSTLVRIKDPNGSGACAVNSATPGPGCFQNNIIPGNEINKQEQALLNIIYQNTLVKNPQFAFDNVAISNNNYNYITNNSANKPVNQTIFRIDYAPTQKLHMFGRGDLETVNDNSFASPANKLPWLMRVNYRTTNPNFVYNVIYTFSPTVVNELNLGTAGWSEAQLYDKSDLAKVQLNSNGYNIPALYSGVNPLNLLPAVSFGLKNSSDFGWDSRFPMADQVRSYSVTDNVTWILGKHTLKAGVDAQTDSYLQVNHNRVGNFSYATDTKNPNNYNFAYANTLLGHFDTMSEVTQLVNYKPRTNAFEWYTQDQWQATKKLLLDYGIRYSWAMAQRLSAGNNFAPSLYTSSNAPILYQPLNSTNSVDPTTGAKYPAAYAGLFVPNTGDLNNGVLSVNTKGFPQGTVYSNGILFAPRVGFAFDPTGRGDMVIRGGYGIFYNVRARSGQEGDLTNNAPTTNSPEQFYGNINTFQTAGGLNGPFSVSHAIPLHAPEIYTENVSLGVQQKVGWGTVFDMAYVGTFGRHVSDYTPVNEVPYNAQFLWSSHSPAGGILPDNFFRPYPGFGTINMQYFNLTSNYNALQAQITHRFNRGLEFGVAYTWGRAMDFTDSYNGTVTMYQNLRAWDYGPAGWDIRNNLVVNYLWNLPKVSHAWNNFFTRAVLDNWQISGIASRISGAPGSVGLKTSNSANITGGGDGARVRLTCDPMAGAPRSFGHWFNPGCVTVPIAGSPATSATSGFKPGDPGNAPKVNYYLPADTNFDTALFKNIPFYREAQLQFRLETYNTFNHPEFNALNSTATFKDANSSSNAETDATFGQLTGALNPRLVQLALRINF